MPKVSRGKLLSNHGYARGYGSGDIVDNSNSLYVGSVNSAGRGFGGGYASAYGQPSIRVCGSSGYGQGRVRFTVYTVVGDQERDRIIIRHGS